MRVFQTWNEIKICSNTLDVVGDNAKQKEDFTNFMRELILNFPKLIKIQSNELTVARSNL